MSGWHHRCNCGCGAPGVPCRGYIPPPGDYKPYGGPPYSVVPPSAPPGSYRPPFQGGPYYPQQTNQSYGSGFGVGWVPPSHCMGTFRWQTSYGGSVPPDAVHAGSDLNGGPIYAGRAFHEGDLLPAKVTPAHGCAYISYAGEEHRKMEYEVLCSNHVAWKFCEGGAVPPEAIRIGNTASGEHLFMGRTMVDGTLTPGKVHPSHGCLYVPYDGRELRFSSYEVLVLS
ncbi:hypothetical protein O3M35_010327 [Rhynocoris fuscipes]|uniref:Uncharacterized protein n=1 Tax=Rhynocoris fuscipes TaxID=488301 RepID=A0AAW1D5K1_9HEMI